jgi:hypothetical protein
MLLKIVLTGLAVTLAGCGTPASVPIDRQPDGRLLLPCDVPPIPPAKVTAADASKGWIESTRIALQCGADKAALVYFIQNKGKTSASTK